MKTDREKVKEAIIEIVKNKKNEGVEPVFATVGDIVAHTGMHISDVNCELSMLRSSGVIKQVEYWGDIKHSHPYNLSWGYIIADAKQKQALIDMMRGDEEIGLYDDNPKNH
jgi:methionine synthase II (cobalamin-independent)